MRGRASLFRGKAGGERINGTITKRGAVCAKQHRTVLAQIAGIKPDEVSDADLVEYLARGEAETRAYLGKSTRASND